MAYEYMTGMGQQEPAWLPKEHPFVTTAMERRHLLEQQLELDQSGACPTGYNVTTIPGVGRSMPTTACVISPGSAPVNLSYPATRTESCAPGGGYHKSCAGDTCFCVTGSGSAPRSWSEHEARVAAASPLAPSSCPTNCWWDESSRRCECAPYGPLPSAPPEPVETPPQPVVTNGQAQPEAARPIPWGWIAIAALGAGALVWFVKR